MKFRLNRKSFERLKALIRAGKYVDRAWSFTAADSNALLGDPPNWAEFQQWFLGIEADKPETLSQGNGQDQQPHKDWYAYPFGKGDVVNLAALRAIASRASAAGEADIADAASQALAGAKEQDTDQATADGGSVKGEACDLAIAFSVPAKLQAAAAGQSPRFTADAYTGAAMDLEGWTHPVVIDFDGLDVTAKSRPVLRDHDPKRPIGHTDNFAIDAGVLKAAGVISVKSQDATEVVESGKNGFPWQISVGAGVRRNEFVPEGSTAQANGKTWAGPINIARQTGLREISFLSLGADDDTSARIAAAAASGSGMKFKKKFAAWARAAGFKLSAMSDDEAKAAKTAFKAAMKCEADDPNDEDDDGKDADAAAKAAPIQAAATTAPGPLTASAAAEEAVKAIRAAAAKEQGRIAGITVKLEEYRPNVPADKFADIQAKALGGEYDLDKTELELIKARRPTASPMINTGTGAQTDGLIIAAAAARSMGVNEKTAFRGLNEQQSNIAASMQGLTLHAIIAMVAPRVNMQAHAGGIDDSFITEFCRADRASHRQQLLAARSSGMILASSGGGFTTMSLTGITENILNKMMLEQYNLQQTIVPDLAYERDTNDFKPFKVYRLTANGTLQDVPVSGELKNIGLQDESYSNQVGTKGGLLTLGRELIVNDDMGALTGAAQLLGRQAQLSRERKVVQTFLAGTSTTAPGNSTGKPARAFNFFSTGAKNYQSGGGSALSLTSLQTAEQQFMEQKDENGDPIGILPDRLLVSPKNKTVAENLFNGANLVVQALDLPAATSGTAAAQTGKQVPNANNFKGKYRPVVSAYLSSQFLGNDNQWALLPSPAGGMATVQVGYLRGQRTPIIRQVETDATILGIAYQVIFDFGVALLDYRCGQYSAGQ